MKVLVATRRSQGARELDLDHCVEGELVWIAEPCGRGLDPGHGRCSCSITFVGVASFGLTTTALVADLEAMTPARYEESLADALHGVRGLDAHLRETTEELAAVAAALPPGTVLERFAGWVQPRFDPETSALNPSLLDAPELHD